MGSLARAGLVAMTLAFSATSMTASASTLNGPRESVRLTETQRSPDACGVASAWASAPCAAGKKHASSGEPFKYRGFKKIWL